MELTTSSFTRRGGSGRVLGVESCLLMTLAP
jgi:hypothetical protein